MPGSRTKVLFVGAFPPADKPIFGGMVSSCRALMQSSFVDRFDLALIDSAQISNPPPSFPIRLVLALRRLGIFLFRIEKNKPDAVLLFAAVGASLVEKGTMAWYSRLRGVPALLFPRGGSVIEACRTSSSSRFWIRLAFGGARTVLCQGSVWQEFAINVLGLSTENAPIIQNWTATVKLLKIASERVFSDTRSNVRLLFIGWLDREKGIFELLEACRRLMPTSSFTLDLAGEGNASEAARSFVRKHGLSENIRFHGWVEGTSLDQLYRQSDVLVLPSWAEGLPNAMVEAMAAKLAIVTTSVGNIPDVIVDGVSGLLVPPRNTDALASALARVIDHPGLREDIAAAGYGIARDNFSVEAAVEKLALAINEAIACGNESKYGLRK